MASQTTTYLFIICGLMLLFHITGAIPAGQTPNSLLLNLLLSPESVQNSSFFSQIVTAIEVILAIGLVVGSIVGKNFELVATSALTIFLINIFFDLIAVFAVVNSYSTVWALLILSPFTIYYVISAFDWWRGRD